jgi:hypothetical protein
VVNGSIYGSYIWKSSVGRQELFFCVRPTKTSSSACLPFHGQWPQNNIINLYPSKVNFIARVVTLAMIHYNFGSYKQTHLTSTSRFYYKWHIGPKIQHKMDTIITSSGRILKVVSNFERWTFIEVQPKFIHIIIIKT